jgi:hypothetical protein
MRAFNNSNSHHTDLIQDIQAANWHIIIDKQDTMKVKQGMTTYSLG